MEAHTPAKHEQSGSVVGRHGRWARAGRVKPILLLWALGIPIPLILLVLLIRGCM